MLQAEHSISQKSSLPKGKVRDVTAADSIVP